MRALLICSLVALAACRTGSLGHCGSDSDCPSGAICDPAAKVCAVPTGGCFPGCASGFSCRNTGCVDDQPPAITGITVLTLPDLPGTVIYRGDDAGTVAVAAQITDPSGVANVCLGVAGESGCPHAGASADGGYWTFTMPRAPSTGTNDGTPVAFTISADDQPDGSVPHHGSASSSILFDNVGPAIQIASDVVAYARLLPDGGADSLPIQVTIADGSGVCDAGSCAPLLDAGFPNFVSYSAQSGGVFTFNLPATLAAAGKESSLGFTVTAQDWLGHKSSAAGARFVDDAAPGVTLKVWRTGDSEPPGTSGVTAPVSVPNTGYNGSRFLYSDSVHVKGSISDDGGIADVQWRIDGVEPDGGPTTGMTHSICVPGT